MLPRLLCKLLGHRFTGGRTYPDGRTVKWCQREQREIVTFPGWEAINRGSHT